MKVQDRVPKERYFDPEFFQMEAELLWPRIWQMACRLEEIPNPHDYVEYEILDQSVIVVRSDDIDRPRVPERVPASRRYVSPKDAGTCESGFTCPFHGWCYGLDGTNTFVPTCGHVHGGQPATGGDRPRPGAVRGVGRLRLDQPRRERARRCANASNPLPP